VTTRNAAVLRTVNDYKPFGPDIGIADGTLTHLVAVLAREQLARNPFEAVNLQSIALHLGMVGNRPFAFNDVIAGLIKRHRKNLLRVVVHHGFSRARVHVSERLVSRMYRGLQGRLVLRRQPTLFDHLVGAGEKGRWDFEAERFRCL
jgi:hypothetical protein